MKRKDLLTWLINTLEPNTRQANNLFTIAIDNIMNGTFTTRIEVINFLYQK